MNAFFHNSVDHSYHSLVSLCWSDIADMIEGGMANNLVYASSRPRKHCCFPHGKGNHTKSLVRLFVQNHWTWTFAFRALLVVGHVMGLWRGSRNTLGNLLGPVSEIFMLSTPSYPTFLTWIYYYNLRTTCILCWKKPCYVTIHLVAL